MKADKRKAIRIKGRMKKDAGETGAAPAETESRGEKRIRLPKMSGRRRRAVSDAVQAESGSSGPVIHSSEPILRVMDDGRRSVWTKDLLLNCSCAAMLLTAIALFCMSINDPLLILFALPCPAVFMAFTTLGDVKPGKVKWIAAAAAAVILLLTAIIWHKAIFGGLGMLFNRFYDVAEQAQAYVYDRFNNGFSASEGAGRAGLAWASSLIGLLAALPRPEARRRISGVIAIAVMLAFAYYGLIPSAVCMAVMTAVLIIAVSRGSLLSFAPVILAVMLIFGVIMLADPGEIRGVSRLDENLRDRFALRSALLESQDDFEDEFEEDGFDDEDEEEEEDEYEDEDYEGEVGAYIAGGLAILAVAGLAAALFVMLRRNAKRRALYRKNINSSDARTAVTAMFPYAVRWLKGYGIEQPGPSFTSMVPDIREEFSDKYTDRFRCMYMVWSEAAYSDHPVSDTSKTLMNAFMQETVDQVKERSRLRDKLRLRFRHAL